MAVDFSVRRSRGSIAGQARHYPLSSFPWLLSWRLGHKIIVEQIRPCYTTSSPSPLMKRILITGSSGYIGQHLIASLLSSSSNDDDDVSYELYCAYNTLATFESDIEHLILDAATTTTTKQQCEESTKEQQQQEQRRPMARIACVIPGIDFSLPNWDKKIYHAITEERKNCNTASCNGNNSDEGGMVFDVIIHLAAISSPTKCQDDPKTTMRVNCPTQLLSMSSIIIYMSTDQVYEGNQSYYIEEDDDDDNILVNPINVYGQSKAKFETCLLDSKHHAGSIILRCSLVLGPAPPLIHGCSKGMDCPTFLQFVEGRLKSNTLTDYYIDEYRSVVHINDVVLTIRHFLNNACLTPPPPPPPPLTTTTTATTSTVTKETTKKVTRVYNLGGSTRVSRCDIAIGVANYLQLDTSSIKTVNRPIIGSGSTGGTTGGGGAVPSPADISMNVSKLTNELGVERMLGLDEIVALTYGERDAYM